MESFLYVWLCALKAFCNWNYFHFQCYLFCLKRVLNFIQYNKFSSILFFVLFSDSGNIDFSISSIICLLFLIFLKCNSCTFFMLKIIILFNKNWTIIYFVIRFSILSFTVVVKLSVYSLRRTSMFNKTIYDRCCMYCLPQSK